jgi:hypothetical protein
MYKEVTPAAKAVSIQSYMAVNHEHAVTYENTRKLEFHTVEIPLQSQETRRRGEKGGRKCVLYLVQSDPIVHHSELVSFAAKMSLVVPYHISLPAS